jgi:hypothetical protein
VEYGAVVFGVRVVDDFEALLKGAGLVVLAFGAVCEVVLVDEVDGLWGEASAGKAHYIVEGELRLLKGDFVGFEDVVEFVFGDTLAFYEFP